MSTLCSRYMKVIASDRMALVNLVPPSRRVSLKTTCCTVQAFFAPSQDVCVTTSTRFLPLGHVALTLPSFVPVARAAKVGA